MSRSTRFSASIAPAASSQEMPWIEAQETSMSNSSAALVGAAGMKPRNRGLSAEITAGASTEVYAPSTWSGLCGSSPISPSSTAVMASASGLAAVQRHRVEAQPVLRVGEYRADHHLGGRVHTVHAANLGGGRRPGKTRAAKPVPQDPVPQNPAQTRCQAAVSGPGSRTE